MKGKEAKAHKALSKLLRVPQDSHIVTSQYAEVASNLHHERSIGTDSYAACFKSGEAKVRKRVLTGIAIQALQQLSGINFIFYYGTTFFANSGIENPFIITSTSTCSNQACPELTGSRVVATNVVNVGMTVPGILAVDKVGRRSLLLYGAIAMAVSQRKLSHASSKCRKPDLLRSQSLSPSSASPSAQTMMRATRYVWRPVQGNKYTNESPTGAHCLRLHLHRSLRRHLGEGRN